MDADPFRLLYGPWIMLGCVVWPLQRGNGGWSMRGRVALYAFTVTVAGYCGANDNAMGAVH